tara:strand:- start:284 stop:655 length:372 start_codon:yes stop_codon:yes gene_type:complete
MILWIKDKWEIVASTVVVLLVFVLGRKSKQSRMVVAEATVDLREKELEVEKELSAEEKLALAIVHQKYINTRISLRKQHRTSTDELEREVINRKMELLEISKDNPEEIDRILLKEFNIANLEK